MKNHLVLLLLLLCPPFWILHPPNNALAHARSDPSLSPPPYASPATSSPEDKSSSKKHHKDPSRKLLISLIAAAIALGTSLLLMGCFWIYHRKKIHKSHDTIHSPDVVKGLALSSYISKYNYSKSNCGKRHVSSLEYNTLESATNGFQESEILGGGGFGFVYKGKLEDNLYVAVKRLEVGRPNAIKEFEAEIEVLGTIQHPNIISLLGYSIHADTRLLVYELMQNGSLEYQLHGPSHGSALAWHNRLKIALDTARGLEYLHEHCKPPVIHRDLKSSNILLDANFNAKISDFGLAVRDGAQSKNNIKLSGTVGYVAPEYLLDGILTDKSDVYGFGVVLLELLLGKRPVEKLAPAQCQSIVTWAMPQLTDRSKLPNIVDPVIKDTMDIKHLFQVAAVAVLCVQPEPSYRPLITDVLHSLIPLVPVELGGTLRVVSQQPS
ncbi:PREDICTED: probable receptor-like protein kinase At1g80640 [Ipomoea nil]|uniref:probable receptor-like protein kinase At1g80640 n=1 Tax=Ipomoea nil TaxID=35883 RepID=UPI0009014180|nr:PREDICTED: probable receptor-like protein kinase At1g80640 [Ipomoea nil]